MMKDYHLVSKSLSLLHHFFAENGQRGVMLTASQCREISRTMGDLHDAAVMLECRQHIHPNSRINRLWLVSLPQGRTTEQTAQIIPFNLRAAANANKKV